MIEPKGMESSTTIQFMMDALKGNKHQKTKRYGSYKAYENSKDKERAEHRIYRYAEASPKHVIRIQKRLSKEHKALRQKKVVILTLFIIVGALLIFYII